MENIEFKIEQQVASMDVLVPLIKERLAAGQSVRFSPKGISMLPMLREGIDTVTLSAITDTVRKYDVLLYQRDDGKYVLHRVIAVGETYTFIGDNQFNKERGIRKEQLISVVTSFTRNGKDISVHSFLYKLYCVFWCSTRFPRRVLRAIRNRTMRFF